MKSKKGNKINLSKIFFLACIISVFSAGFGNITDKLFILENRQDKVVNFDSELTEMKRVMNVDSRRLYNIQKIMNIIDRYDPSILTGTKYKYASEIYRLSQKYSNLTIDLICATISHESAGTWDPTVTSWAGAMGLMQIMPYTGIQLAAQEGIAWTNAEEILFDPINNLRLGSRYLSELIEIYGLEGGLAAYNGGERKAALWLANNKAANILYKETQGYIPAVLKLYKDYQN